MPTGFFIVETVTSYWPHLSVRSNIYLSYFESTLILFFAVNLATFSHGLGIGWMAPTMRLLQTDESPLTFALIVEQISWIGSVLGVGSIIGNLVAGFLQDRVGRKPVLYGLAVPYIVSY